MCVGPKSCRHNGKEIFDPGLSGEVQRLELEGISVNGQEVHDISQYVREIVFDHLYPEAPSFARGTIHALVCKQTCKFVHIRARKMSQKSRQIAAPR